MAKMIFLNMPVADVEKSAKFYEALGFTRNEHFSNPGMCASMVWSDTITLMVLSHDFYRSFVPHKAVADAASTSEMIICLSCDSRAEVDAFVEAAIAAGATADATPADDHGHMYGRNCEDLDGHILNAVWMDVDAFLASQQQAAMADA